MSGPVHDRAQLGAYAIGALDPAEARMVHEHLAGCLECQQEVNELMMIRRALDQVPPEAFLDGPPEDGELLLRGVRYIKDNRLLPRGFDKATAAQDIAVRGGAQQDRDFTGESDRVRYMVSAAGHSGPFQVSAELRYQPISYRWAQNLRAYDAGETRRFVNWYDEMASGSSQVLASVTTTTPQEERRFRN